MLRRDLVDLLLNHPMTVKDVSRYMKATPKTLEDDLRHLFKSLKHTEFVEKVTPAKCRKCGFEFSADKLKKPSKCPDCHGTWLYEPLIAIEEKV